MFALVKIIAAFAITAAAALFTTSAVVMLHAPVTKRWKLLVTSLVHGVLLTIALALWFNARPGFFEQNKLAFDLTTDLRSWRGIPDPLRDQGVGFVLIDNSENKAIVPPRSATDSGRQQVPITDRAMLAELLAFLGSHADRLSLVVCDITFPDPSRHDSALAASMSDLIVHDKLILAETRERNTPLLRPGNRYMGRATEQLQNGLIAAHNLYLDGEPSIPCLMYMRTTGASIAPSWTTLLLREKGPTPAAVFPAFPAALDRFDERCTTIRTDDADEGNATAPPYFPLGLGYAISEFGREDLLLMIEEQARDARIPPIVMVGEFNAPLGERMGADRHSTFGGTMQGSTILIDLYLEMLDGAHRVPWLGLLATIILLSLLSLIIFSRPWGGCRAMRDGQAKELKAVEPVAAAKLKVDAWGVPAARAVLAFALKDHVWKNMKDAFPLLLFFGIFIALDLWLGIRINLAAFIAYFLVLNAFFKKLDLRRTT
ncbi:MAG TPA: CHASE2 domain-containing protein [Flavobacteriales bacterium]|nr:CHASE2 domain-containing protein [Flavobacteriales bacterium]